MNTSANWKHYSISQNFDVSINFVRRARALRQFLSTLEVEKAHPSKNQIILCARRNELPKEDLRGRYKSISWAVCIKENENVKQVYFWSAHLFSFLALRVVLIPWTKELLSKNGGYELPGSAFQYKGKTFVIFGMPGAGKTKVTLEAVQRGASFVGDDELMIQNDLSVTSFFGDLELRYDTVKSTVFWEQLPADKKLKAGINLMISRLTCGMVSPNLVLSPKEVGMNPISAALFDVFIILGNFERIRKASREEAAEVLLEYDAEYQNLYGTLFNSMSTNVKKQLLEKLFSRMPVWFVPSGSSAEKVFELL